jgi:SAM-dependent methyltransferase
MSAGGTTTTWLAAPDACHVCGKATLDELADFAALRRVTSDCRPWPAGGRLFACRSCGCAQKVADDAWAREAAAIYAGYEIYHQAAGAEQAVFDSAGRAASRSSRLVEALRAHVSLPRRGRMLDVGCGNGATLRAFSQAFSGWSLVGSELDDRHRRLIESIEGVESLHTCAPAEIPGRFDLVTMVHVLEHLPGPGPFLEGLLDRLAEGGRLVIEVPHHPSNPFELLIADHCTHFTAGPLELLLRRSGYSIALAACDWVPKELTAIAGAREGTARDDGPAQSSTEARRSLESGVRWLGEVSRAARRAAERGSFGLFGTSIAAMWLFGELGEAVEFFVDEDPNRAGTTLRGRPVWGPSEVPGGSNVFLALPAGIAEGVLRRIERPGIACHAAPTP